MSKSVAAPTMRRAASARVGELQGPTPWLLGEHGVVAVAWLRQGDARLLELDGGGDAIRYAAVDVGHSRAEGARGGPASPIQAFDDISGSELESIRLGSLPA